MIPHTETKFFQIRVRVFIVPSLTFTAQNQGRARRKGFGKPGPLSRRRPVEIFRCARHNSRNIVSNV